MAKRIIFTFPLIYRMSRPGTYVPVIRYLRCSQYPTCFIESPSKFVLANISIVFGNLLIAIKCYENKIETSP